MQWRAESLLSFLLSLFPPHPPASSYWGLNPWSWTHWVNALPLNWRPSSSFCFCLNSPTETYTPAKLVPWYRVEIKCECPELDHLLLLIFSLYSITTLISASLGAGRGLYCRQKADILSHRERESFRIKKGTKIWECLIISHPIPEPQGALKKEGQRKGSGRLQA